MRHLVILAHADPSVGDGYRSTLNATIEQPVDLVFCNAFQYGGFSSAYRQLAAKLKRKRVHCDLLRDALDKAEGE